MNLRTIAARLEALKGMEHELGVPVEEMAKAVLLTNNEIEDTPDTQTIRLQNAGSLLNALNELEKTAQTAKLETEQKQAVYEAEQQAEQRKREDKLGLTKEGIARDTQNQDDKQAQTAQETQAAFDRKMAELTEPKQELNDMWQRAALELSVFGYIVSPEVGAGTGLPVGPQKRKKKKKQQGDYSFVLPPTGPAPR
ncbi:MAG: hypothetical protein IJP30_04310 [Clostridia bacterium]|nr:hypothetical protein [Clostridia bacterium]